MNSLETKIRGKIRKYKKPEVKQDFVPTTISLGNYEEKKGKSLFGLFVYININTDDNFECEVIPNLKNQI